MGYSILPYNAIAREVHEGRLRSWRIITPELKRDVHLVRPADRPMTNAGAAIEALCRETLVSLVEWSGAKACGALLGRCPGRLFSGGLRLVTPHHPVMTAFQYYGFEVCGDVAEEVPNPTRTIPRAMRLTIYIGGAAAMFVCLALILSIKDIGAVIAGKDTDPVWTILTSNFGEGGARMVLLVVLVSFLSCVLSLQAAASRLLFSFARDGMLPASEALRKLNSHHVPYVALLLCGIVPAIIALGGYFLANAVAVVIAFAAVGIAFQLVVAGALMARARGWQPSGDFKLGGWGKIVNICALIYGVAAIVNLAWPRMPDSVWYQNYAVVLSSCVVVAAGLLIVPFFARRASDELSVSRA